jgi:hypothetical protein
MSKSKNVQWGAWVAGIAMITTIILVFKFRYESSDQDMTRGGVQNNSEERVSPVANELSPDVQDEAKAGLDRADRAAESTESVTSTVPQSIDSNSEKTHSVVSNGAEQSHSPIGVGSASRDTAKEDGAGHPGAKLKVPETGGSAKTNLRVFPGIQQKQGRIMVRDLKIQSMDESDEITVVLEKFQTKDLSSCRLWLIGEYVQRGTAGIMFVPSHEALEIASDGVPSQTKVGTKVIIGTVAEKKLVLRRPGFEGEELVAVRVGVWDENTQALHSARASVKDLNKNRIGAPRAKVNVK